MSKRKNNRTCVVCGKQYSYCTHGCTNDLDKPAWMANYDTYNCKLICELFTGNTIGKFISDEKAKEELAKLDLSNKDNFKPSIKEWIDRITFEPQQEESKEEVVEEVLEKRYVSKKPFKNKNRSHGDKVISLEND